MGAPGRSLFDQIEEDEDEKRASLFDQIEAGASVGAQDAGHPSFIDYQPPGPAPDPRAAELEDYLTGGDRGILSTLGDAAQSLSPRLLGMGGMMPSDDDRARSEQMAEYARERSPTASKIAGIAGDVGEGIALGSIGLPPGAAGAAQSGLQSAYAGDDLLKTAENASAGYLFGRAGEMVGQGIGAARDWALDVAAPYLNKVANVNRVAATGQYGTSLDALRANKGEDFIQQLGQDIESAGLHDRPGILGMFPGWAGRYKANADRLAGVGGPRMRVAEDSINALERPPSVDVGDIIDDQAAKAEGARTLVDPSAGPLQADFRQGFADNLTEAGGANGELPFNEALRQRRALDEEIPWTSKGGYEGGPMQEQVRREVVGDLRSNIGNALDESVAAGDVPFGMANDWKMGRDEFALGREVGDPAVSRQYREIGNQLGSLPTKNLLTNPIAAAGSELMKYGGRSAVAGSARGMANTARGFGTSPGIAEMEEYLQSGAQAGLVGGAVGSDPDARMREVALDGNGTVLAQNIKDALITQPDALGPYRAQFEFAGKDPIGIAALLNRLKTDQRWVQQYQPMFLGAR